MTELKGLDTWTVDRVHYIGVGAFFFFVQTQPYTIFARIICLQQFRRIHHIKLGAGGAVRRKPMREDEEAG